ncbi:MAG: carboxypeptidase-like regulatory domain-containing protein [Bryobacteraceae bacterium]
MVSRFASILLLFLTLSIPGFSQFAAVIGRVTDASGAVLPEVKIVARNIATGVTTGTVTNAEGYFALPNLPVGSYVINMEKAGFNKDQATEVKLQVGQTARFDLTLQVGEVLTSVGGARLGSCNPVRDLVGGRGGGVQADPGGAAERAQPVCRARTGAWGAKRGHQSSRRRRSGELQ